MRNSCTVVKPDGATVDYDKPRLQISYQTMYCEDTENINSYLYYLYTHHALISYKISDNKIFAINNYPE